MKFFRRGSSSRSSKGVLGDAYDHDLNISRRAEVRPCEWPHNTFMNEAGIRQEFAQFVTNAGLTDFLAYECDQHHILTNSFMQKFYFMPRLDFPMVCFDLYAEHHELTLDEFCEICLIPSDGDLREPRPEVFEDFLRTLTVGEFRGVSKAHVTSLHFPVVHYFALFIGKCLTAREEGGVLSAPDLAICYL